MPAGALSQKDCNSNSLCDIFLLVSLNLEFMSRTNYYQGTFLSHCSVSPLHPVALEAEQEFLIRLAEKGVEAYESYLEVGNVFRRSIAHFLRTDPINLAFVGNTAAGLNFISNGYPFEAGDRILTYSREYGSNHYPWVIAANKFQLELDFLPDIDPLGGLPDDAARGWSLEDLDRLITDRTRIVALSHVQFVSGFAADLFEVGKICRARGVDLVIDAAQSFGCLPLYPDEWGISAISTCGSKWYMGPPGSGVFFTSEAFRHKLAHVMGGALMMKGWTEYQNLTWRPFEDARRFEYATVPWGYIHALGQLTEKVFVPEGIENIRRKIFANQQILIDGLDSEKCTVLQFPDANRSGILAVLPKNRSSTEIVAESKKQGLVLISHEPYIRIAPHFYNRAEQMKGAVELLNRLL